MSFLLQVVLIFFILLLVSVVASEFQVVTTGKVTKEDRTRAWSELKNAAKEKKTRPFYRAADRKGHMYAGKYVDVKRFGSENDSIEFE